MPTKKLTQDLKARIEHDENFQLKLVGELGDIARLVRGLIARIDKLEKRMDMICPKKINKI